MAGERSELEAGGSFDPSEQEDGGLRIYGAQKQFVCAQAPKMSLLHCLT